MQEPIYRPRAGQVEIRNLAVDRRTVLLGVAATTLGAAVLTPAYVPATAAEDTRIRPSVRSQEGKKALISYRKGVEIMRQRSVASPTLAELDRTSWVYQALIHGITLRVPKQRFIDQIVFQEVPVDDPLRQLAVACWSTCPHSTIDFLPWHRLYLYFFERIVRDASGDPTFVLPYWDYSQGGEHAQIPMELREAVGGSPLDNALFNPARDMLMNGIFGKAAELPPTDVVLDALQQATFEATSSEDGFSAAVENIPHNMVHGDVGGSDDIGFPVGDMSTTNTAGRDPIFWLHHANMDRLWESWLRMGGETTESYSASPWYNKQWTFVDDKGSRRDLSLADLDQILKSEPINYERYEQIARKMPMVVASASTDVIMRGADSVTLSSMGARIEFEIPQDKVLTANPMAKIQSARVVLENVVAQSELAVTFDVFLNLSSENKANDQRIIGSFNFFGATHEGVPHSKRYIFDITEQIRSQMAAGQLPTTISISILPRKRFVGQPVTVGTVSLVIQQAILK